MGIFSSIYNKELKQLQEVEKTVDGDVEDLSAGDTSSTTDYTEDADDNLNLPEDETEETTEEDDVGEPEGDDTTESEDEEPADDEPTDYSDGVDDAIGTNDDQTDDTDTTSSEPPEETEPADKSDLQNLEMELFSDLTPEQINIKHYELKKQYMDLYTRTEEIINKINTVSKTEQNVHIFDFVSKKIIELREIINFYLINVYSTRTYIENSTNYQQYLAVLSAIHKIIAEIDTEND